MILALPILRFRHYLGKMSVTGSKSAAISAACHRKGDAGPDITMYPVKHGVFNDILYPCISSVAPRQ